MSVVAFSSSSLRRQCVDCDQPAVRLVSYVLYEIGDLCCAVHAGWRSRTLTRVRCVVGPIPVRSELRLA